MLSLISKLALPVLVILLSVALPCHCDDDVQTAGGKFIGKDDFLWFAALAEDRDDFFCSGALISARHVMTADHCLRGKALESVRVRIGYFCPRPDNCGARAFTNLNVIERRRDPSLGDIAILVLERKVPSPFVPAVPDVASTSYLSRVGKGGKMTLVGAGRVSTSGEIAKQAQTLQLQLRYYNFKKCRRSISDEELKETLVSKATICSTSDQGSPCQGDSGSAIIVNDGRVGNVIVGINSYVPRNCSGAGDDDFFGHVAVSKVADFVVSVVCFGSNNGNDDDKKETWCPPTSSPPSSPPNTPPSPPTCTCDEESCQPVCDSILPLPCLPDATTPPPSLAPISVLKPESLRATLLHEFTDHTNNVLAVAFDATSSFMASTGLDKRVKVWDPSSGGSPLMEFALDSIFPDSLTFDPTGRFLAVDDGKNVVVLDVSDTNDSNKPRQVLTGHTAEAEGLAWHPDGDMLASGSNDKTVRLWNVSAGNVLHTFQGHTNEVDGVAFEPQGRYLASGSDDRTIRIWDVTSLAHVRTLEGHTGEVSSVTYSPDGTKLASGSVDGTVRVWGASDGSPLAVFSVGSIVSSVAWSSDGHFLVSGSSDKRVRVWDATQSEGEEALLKWKAHSRSVWSVAWSGNGKWIASGSLDDTVKVWEMTSE